MSQKTKSIADALKSSPLKRPNPVIDNSVVAEPENSSRFSDSQSANYSNDTSEETSEIVSELPGDNNEREETTSSEDLIARLSRLQASSKDETDEPLEESHYEEQPHRATSRQRHQQRSLGQDRQRRSPALTRNVSSQRNGGQNFRAESNYYHNQVNRRDESEDMDDAENEFPEKYAPRPPSSTRRPNSRYADEVKTPAVKRPVAPQPFRTSRRGASGRPASNHDLPVRSPSRNVTSAARFAERDREVEYSHQGSQLHSQATYPSHSARPVTSRGRSVPAQLSSRYQVPATRESFDRQWSTDSPEVERGLKSSQNSGFRAVGSGTRSNPPTGNVQSRKFEAEDYSDDLDQPQPERQVRILSSHENSAQFTGLSKTIVTKISKTVGISSLAADVYETLKELSGNFMYDVLSETSPATDNISSAELEPIVEAKLGRPLEDLDQSFLSANVFSRWVRGVTDELQVGIRNEAVLFLQQVLEFYLVELLTNSRDVAEQAGRSRVMVKDVLLASRMR